MTHFLEDIQVIIIESPAYE